MSASELVKSRAARATGSSTAAGSSSSAVHYRPIAPVTPIPTVEPPPKAKRGRKPHPGSKSAREALRKESHSRIEKRRREKINDALTTLRELIAQGEGGPKQQQEQSPPPGPEREFKLELLERTVSFVRGLLERTQELERELNELKGEDGPARKRKRMATPASSPSAGPSQQRTSAEVDELDLDDSSTLSEPESERAPSPIEVEAASPMVFPTAAPRRSSMSIAALLSPATHPALPSPPPSGHFRTAGPIPEGAEPQMETLSLPSPEVILRRASSSERSLKRPRTEEGERRMDEDTVAAALLLQFSSKTPRSMLGMH